VSAACLPPDPSVLGDHHFRDAEGRVIVARWVPGAGRWGVLFGGTHLPETLARAGWTYLEPVLTPAEVDELHVELHNLAVQVAEMQASLDARSDRIQQLVADRLRLKRALHVLAPALYPDPEGETG